MAKKYQLAAGVLLSALSATSIAYTDAEIISAIKTKPVNAELIKQMVTDEAFNPFRTINGLDLKVISDRYNNEFFSTSVEVKQLNLRESSKPLNHSALVTTASLYDSNKLNLIIASGNNYNALKTYLEATRPTAEQINTADNNGHTPLAALLLTSDPRGRGESIKLLANDYGADINLPNVGEHKDTPFGAACRSGNIVDMTTLLILGAKWFEMSGNGEEILTISQKNIICNEIINKLIQ